VYVKNVPCAADLTKTGHAGRYSFGNAFIIGEVSVQNHHKIFSGVFRNEIISIKVRRGVTNLQCIGLLPNTISLVLFGFNSKRLSKHHCPILCKSSLKSAKASKLLFILKKIIMCCLHNSEHCTSVVLKEGH